MTAANGGNRVAVMERMSIKTWFGFPDSKTAPSAFTLVELLAVVAAITTLTAVSMPMLRSLSRETSVAKAAANLALTLESARAYAMANNTYVRVALGRCEQGLSSATAVLCLSSADGSLSADSASDMNDSRKWPLLGKPIVLEHLNIYGSEKSFDAVYPNTMGDATPDAHGDSQIERFERRLNGLGNVNFSSFIQFNPAGEARVLKTEPVRYIKIAMDREQKGASGKQERFILRLSGINGVVSVLRVEHLN
jgi:type II secretory pathway pseudopilin PulG